MLLNEFLSLTVNTVSFQHKPVSIFQKGVCLKCTGFRKKSVGHRSEFKTEEIRVNAQTDFKRCRILSS